MFTISEMMQELYCNPTEQCFTAVTY